jgi:hypothetical protein
MRKSEGSWILGRQLLKPKERLETKETKEREIGMAWHELNSQDTVVAQLDMADFLRDQHIMFLGCVGSNGPSGC